MKKIFTGLLALMLLLSCAAAFAVPPRVQKRRITKRRIIRNKKQKAVLKRRLQKVVIPVRKARIMPRPKVPRSFMELELGAGYLASIPGIVGAVRLHNPMGMVSSSIKLGIAYATGKDSDQVDRKHALLFIDGIYRMAPMFKPGIKPYLGLGINLVAYTSGKKTGAIDGQAYLGLEGRMSRRNSAYLEFGYGLIRTGFSPTYKGLHSIIGFKTII